MYIESSGCVCFETNVLIMFTSSKWPWLIHVSAIDALGRGTGDEPSVYSIYYLYLQGLIKIWQNYLPSIVSTPFSHAKIYMLKG